MAEKEKVPNSYKDPYWADLATKTEQKLDLPQGLLVGILQRGERSNNDQTSSAGAKTPFQVIPETRNAVMKKYGVDAYLSPQNAAEAAGLLLQESLKRNNNDPSMAVAEYVGGVNRKNWGPVTKAYVNRVIGGGSIGAPARQQQAQQSTFQRALAERQAQVPASQSISSIYDAYKSGQMDADSRQQFEQDVQAGRMMLPRGASLEVAKPTQTGAMELPAGVIDAYARGQMTPEEKQQLEADLRSGIVTMPAGASLGQVAAISQISGQDGMPVPSQGLPASEPTIGQQITGGAEALLSAATGMTGGAVGGAYGAVKGLAQNIADGTYGTQQGVRNMEKSMQEAAGALTYAPRSEVGQERVQQLGTVAQNLMPAIPSVGVGVSPLAAARPALQAAGDAALASASRAAPVYRQAAQMATSPVRSAANAVRSAVGAESKQPSPSAQGGPAGRASIGAAGVDEAALRQAQANELPIPIELTRGQRTRGFEDQRFERETAKLGDVGEPIRERFALQNQQLARNLDAFIDATGAVGSESDFRRATGLAVNEALRSRAARDKAQIRVLYKEAEKAGEMADPVDLSPVATYLNESRAGRTSAPIMKTLADELEVQGVGYGSLADGTLQVQPMTLTQAENLRKSINRFAKADDANDLRVASELKKIIDLQTQGAGGEKYQQARKARARYAQNYENIGVIKNLLGTKRGTDDRIVALEDVLNRSVLDASASLDSVRQLRRVLQTEGDLGKQAWREIQGSTLQYIKEQALKGIAPDVSGNRVMSPAQLDRVITGLDRSGKLDFIFGKKGAEQLRTINDVAKTVLTSPAGSVNTSNTATAIAALMDVVGASMTGVPVPVAMGAQHIIRNIKDKKLRARVREHLGK